MYKVRQDLQASLPGGNISGMPLAVTRCSRNRSVRVHKCPKCGLVEDQAVVLAGVTFVPPAARVGRGGQAPRGGRRGPLEEGARRRPPARGRPL